MNTTAIESDVVRNAARGAWLSVLDSLAPELERAIENPGRRHIGCPVMEVLMALDFFVMPISLVEAFVIPAAPNPMGFLY